MKKGFTLIELLAVVVILAVIALIATPVVLNIIDDSKESVVVRSAEGYLRALEYEIAKTYATTSKITDGTYNVLSNGDLCIDGYENNRCTGKILHVDYKNEGPVSGTITLKSAKITNYELNYNSGIMVADGRIGEIIGALDKVCRLTIDENGNGIADAGDMIKCSNESFHVISNDGINITMFAKYNLDVSEDGTGLQSVSAYNISYGTYEDGSGYTKYNLPPFIEHYKNYIESLGIDVEDVKVPSNCVSFEFLSNFTSTNYWTDNETGECAYGEGVYECLSDGTEYQTCWMDDYDGESTPLPHSSGLRPIVIISSNSL